MIALFEPSALVSIYAPGVEPMPTFVWVSLSVFAMVLLVGSLFFRARLQRRRSSDRPLAEPLKVEIMARPLPFSVCSECRLIIDLPSPISCPQCAGLDCCVWVDAESERSIATAAVGTD